MATCEALLCGGINPGVVAETFLRWFQRGRLSRMGSSTLKALRDLNNGVHWALAGRRGEFAAGNGAAMRIAPLAFCTDPSQPQGRQMIRDICRITHHHDEAYVGALATVLAIRESRNSGHSILERVLPRLPDSIVRDRLTSLRDVRTECSILELSRMTGTSGYVAESIPLAILASEKCTSMGFTEMLEGIIQAGGDTDTIASIAGQIAGTSIGLKGLPRPLLERLPEHEELMNIAVRFAEWIAQRKEPH